MPRFLWPRPVLHYYVVSLFQLAFFSMGLTFCTATFCDSVPTFPVLVEAFLGSSATFHISEATYPARKRLFSAYHRLFLPLRILLGFGATFSCSLPNFSGCHFLAPSRRQTILRDGFENRSRRLLLI